MSGSKSSKLYQFLWGCIKPYYGYYLLMLSAPILCGLYVPFTSYAVKMLIDSMSTNNVVSIFNLLGPIALFLITQIFVDILWTLSDYAEWKSEPYVRKSILTNGFEYVQKHSFSYFQNNYTGTITSKLKGILLGYDNIFGIFHHKLLPPLSSFVISAFAFTFANIWLGIFVIAWSVVFLITMFHLTSKIAIYSDKVSESRHNLFGMISDNVSNIITTKLFNLRFREYKKLREQMQNDTIPKEVAMYKYEFKVHIIGTLLYVLLMSSVLVSMIYLKNKGMVTIGDFAFVFGILLSTMQQLWEAIFMLGDLHVSIGDMKQSFSIMDYKHEVVNGKNSKVVKVSKGEIKFKDVTFAYTDNLNVLKQFNLTIKAGEKIGLVGISGVGKSTITHLLLRFFKLNFGEILIDGNNINDIAEHSLYDAISLVPQDTMLFHRTVYENINNGNPKATKEEVESASKLAHVDEFVLKLPQGYDTVIGERGIKMSVGQRQRIAIARALLKDAPIMIFDEATSALDSVTEKYIQKTTQNIIKESNKTMIVIAHRLSTLKNLDRIVFIKDGKVIEEGSHEKLIAKKDGQYNKLWKLQSDFFIF